jgi:hypothetical protein
MKKNLLAAALLSWAAAGAAQMVYKYERPDGTVVYSDKPISGARLIDRFPLIPSAPAPASQERAAPPSRESRPRVETTPPGPGRGAALDLADAEVKAAQKAVDEAKERLQNGVEPLPGERATNVGGTSRLTEAYFARLKQLEQDLKDATERLDQAYQRRNQAK